MKGKWAIIGLSCLMIISFSYGFVMYAHWYNSVPSIKALPKKTNLVVFTGSRRFSPLNIVYGLFVIDVDTGTIWQWELPENVNWGEYIAWIPSLKLLSLYGTVHTADQSVERSGYLLSTEGNITQLQLTTPSTFGEHSWSPDGRKMVFSRPLDTERQNYEIYIQNLDGTDLNRLTNMQTTEAWPNWALYGGKITFESYDPETRNFTIYMINEDGTNLKVLAEQLKGRNRKPQWSPDGTQIAFLHADDNAPYGLWVINPDSGEFKPVFTPSGSENSSQTLGVSSFTWAPDGHRLVFASSHENSCSEHQTSSAEWVDCDEQVYIVELDGSELQTLDLSPQPTHFDFVWIQ